MIDIPPASFRVTPYGEVDAAALERLRESFDTAQVLRAVNQLDACLVELGGVADLSDEQLRLHAMALTLIEGVVLTVPTENTCIWAEAESVQLSLDILISWVRSAQIMIAPLVDLVPDHEQ